MIKVQRTSPVYLAIQYTGNLKELEDALRDIKVESRVTSHQRIGDDEALYAMIEFEGQDQPTFVQKGEWLLFNEISNNLVSTISQYGFNHAFKEVNQ
ncbi:MAG: hypothetical protein [Bacteriophage sp.]|nr:MAG: hypothetical protein [Bacteriophage sp.]